MKKLKNIKLIFSALLTAVLIFSLGIPAFAVGEPTIEIVDRAGEPNETITVTVLLKNNPGITYLRVTPEVDGSAVTLTNVENGSLFPTLDEGINLVWSADSEVKVDGVLCTLTFAISAEAELNSTVSVGLTVRECYNDKYEDVALIVDGGDLTVGCKHTETTDTETKAASCTQAGEKLCVCNACGDEMTVEIPALGHTEGEWVTNKAPAVGVAGEMSVSCTVCNEVVKTQVIPALSGDQGGDIGADDGVTVSGCGKIASDAVASASLFFSSTLSALGVFLGKRFFF